MQLSENTVVADRFRLHRMIGQGGMGSVWEATQIGLERACALKFIEGEMAKLAEAHARFEREAKAAAHLNSPHIVQIFDHGVWQGTPYIAMELLVGEDLGKRLSALGGRLEPQFVSRVIQQVTRALTKAHQAGIVHRDLKPDNIFLVRDDEQEIVKILDFGVAKQTVAGIDGSNTKTGAMLGTPYYMSPEQAQGIKSVDARSDLWSLAVIVYQCLTGRLPFESEALGDLLVKIIVSPIPVPSQVAPGLPPGFDRWWAKAAERNPDLRFQTAKEFNDALQLALGQSSITEVNERRPAFGTGTAVMAQGALGAPEASPSGLGHGAGQTTALTRDPRMSTPSPVIPTPAGPMMPPDGANAVSHPGTFGGVEPPVEVPKRSPPIALIGGIAALAVIGLVIGGVAAMKGRSASASSAPSAASASSAVTAAPTAAVDEPTPAPATSTATAAPAEPAAAASGEPAPTSAAKAAATAATTGRPAAKTASPTPSGSAKATAKTATPTTTATSKTKEKPINLGF